jgi:hypothetical protein
MTKNPIILNLTKSTGFQFSSPSVLDKSQPVIKPTQQVKSESVVKSKRRKSKQVAKYIYSDNNMIILNPKWRR